MEVNAYETNTEYGKKLVNAVIYGVRAAEPSDATRYFSSLLLKSVRLAVGGACTAWLASQMLRRRARLFSALGGAGVGFLAALAWNSRVEARNMAYSVCKEVNRVRDEHWLELNPIDYA